ncbi:hypothetical protein BY996DRAFT_6605686 [Phakopsora pachyrhizi]|nr:hypothetical protein BY996DRAFT_6605686 [Phakopsora pachyrhizi]
MIHDGAGWGWIGIDHTLIDPGAGWQAGEDGAGWVQDQLDPDQSWTWTWGWLAGRRGRLAGEDGAGWVQDQSGFGLILDLDLGLAGRIDWTLIDSKLGPGADWLAGRNEMVNRKQKGLGLAGSGWVQD